MLRSHYVGELNAGMSGKEVTLAGWVHEVRETSKITFLILRDRTGLVQIIGKKGNAEDKIIKQMSLPKESVIAVKGIVQENKEAKKGFEIIPIEITNLNPLSAPIPFEVTGKVPADIDVRLNNRCIDLRRLETKSIFSIEATVLQSFINYLAEMGFQQIRTPSIIGESSEGGSDLFPVQYFEKNAFLAQSPQLYKQLAIIGGMDKVMMIMPVFRAEKSNTVFHLAESTQMDVEMGFANAEDAMDVLSNTVVHIIKEVIKKNGEDLENLKTDLKVPNVKKVTYTDLIKVLQKKGHKIEFGHDISREHEEAIAEIYGDAVLVTKFPKALRAFYSMPIEGTELCDSYDFIYKGLEISSGSQRINKPDVLVKSLESKGLNPKDFESYISAFRLGAPPHAGWSIGMERFAMRITGAKNIRECALFPRDRNRLRP